MNNKLINILAGYFLLGAVLIVGCRQQDGDETGSSGGPRIAVTNTYLLSAVHDLTGTTTGTFCLAPPGMCPGHFDMAPEQMRRLLASDILYRFDFQAGLDEQLQRLTCPIVPVRGRSGMCLPATYLETCREMLPCLTEALPDKRPVYERNLEQLEQSLTVLSRQLQDRVKTAGLAGTKVLASHHQAAFARWLGLEVAATFRGADSMTPAEIEACLKTAREHDITLVIANLQEGTELPRRLAEHLDGRVVVFSNFPDTGAASVDAFEHLLHTNIARLIEWN